MQSSQIQLPLEKFPETSRRISTEATRKHAEPPEEQFTTNGGGAFAPKLSSSSKQYFAPPFFNPPSRHTVPTGYGPRTQEEFNWFCGTHKTQRCEVLELRGEQERWERESIGKRRRHWSSKKAHHVKDRLFCERNSRCSRKEKGTISQDGNEG